MPQFREVLKIHSIYSLLINSVRTVERVKNNM